jgi:hypothetical protein
MRIYVILYEIRDYSVSLYSVASVFIDSFPHCHRRKEKDPLKRYLEEPKISTFHPYCVQLHLASKIESGSCVIKCQTKELYWLIEIPSFLRFCLKIYYFWWMQTIAEMQHDIIMQGRGGWGSFLIEIEERICLSTSCVSTYCRLEIKTFTAK